MSQPVLLKVYGNLSPAGEELARSVSDCAQNAFPPENVQIYLDGDLLLISFEGIFFPTAETAAVLEKFLKPECVGKLDDLDIENWKMTRYSFAGGKMTKSAAPLDNVLDYSMSGGISAG